jgi:hypothetical protein
MQYVILCPLYQLLWASLFQDLLILMKVLINHSNSALELGIYLHKLTHPRQKAIGFHTNGSLIIHTNDSMNH